ncbi:hypothetical protein CKALI_11385 [Corynebacterium kalinowskii]|uniref:Uncharacterized protein n=1 Tax=Corynebacterium kalinowskii TaxID=2675216 RepID=A0A6B8VT72_9CORY|nr:hypothetical protein [Corynebacterium kalinowskii]QGU03121.1 hypothetical protein CKALI_11385 [Corynebacterium kalinowskii]
MKPSPAQLLQDRIKVALADCLAAIFKAHVLLGLKPAEAKIVVFFNAEPSSFLGIPEVTSAELRMMAASLLNFADRRDETEENKRE